MGGIQQSAQIFSSVSIQIVVVLISILMFNFVKRGSGTKGRYLTHLAISWGIMGCMYLLTAVFEINFGSQFQEIYKQIWNIIDPVLSITNSGFLITAWYMMRDYRIEQEMGVENPLPTMSKPFISIVFATGASIIALFIALVGSIEKEYVLPFFKILDVLISATAIILVGIELLKIHIIREPEEGSFFISDRICRIFKKITLTLYLTWGALQLGHIISQIKNPPDFFIYPTGGLYVLMAILKLSCATTAAILIIHSLPSIKWQHKETKRLRQKKEEEKG